MEEIKLVNRGLERKVEKLEKDNHQLKSTLGPRIGALKHKCNEEGNK